MDGCRVACETYFSSCEHCTLLSQRPPDLVHSGGRSALEWTAASPDGSRSRQDLWRIQDHVGRHAGASRTVGVRDPMPVRPADHRAGDRVLVTGPGTMMTARRAGGSGRRRRREGGRSRARSSSARPGESLGWRLHTQMETMEDSATSTSSLRHPKGHPGGAEIAMGAVRKGGRYVQVGIFGRPITLSFDTVLYGELVVTSGNASTPSSWRRAMHFSRPVSLRSTRWSARWSRSPNGSERLPQPGGGMVETVLDPRSEVSR